MVEAALVTPIFVFLLFGTLEFGLLFRSYLTLNNAAQGGARAASIAGNQLDADWKILQAVRKESAAVGRSSIQRVVVYHAANGTDEPTASCIAGTATSGTGNPNYTGACNVYVSADLTAPVADFGCGITQKDRYWCPTARKTAVSGPMSPPDFVGVYITIRHGWVTGLFGSTVDISERVIVKMEPKALT